MFDPASVKKRLLAGEVILIDVKVVPRSATNGVAGVGTDGVLRVKVAAVPEHGKANEAVCDVLATLFDVPKRGVTIISGATSHRKRIQIRG